MATHKQIGVFGNAVDPRVLDPAYWVDLSGPPTFYAPDQAMLDEAAALECSENSRTEDYSNLNLTLCVPEGWEISVYFGNDPAWGGPSVSISSNPYDPVSPVGSSHDVIARVVIVENAAARDMADCPEPGLMASAIGDSEVCFLNFRSVEGGALPYVLREFWLKPLDHPELLVYFGASRNNFGKEPIGLGDMAYRDALAILVNMRAY